MRALFRRCAKGSRAVCFFAGFQLFAKKNAGDDKEKFNAQITGGKQFSVKYTFVKMMEHDQNTEQKT